MKSVELTGKAVGKILCDLVFGDGFINTPMVLPVTEKKNNNNNKLDKVEQLLHYKSLREFKKMT